MLAYIVSCRSDYRDNLILEYPVGRNKTFDGVFEFYYYFSLEYIIIHFVKIEVFTQFSSGCLYIPDV